MLGKILFNLKLTFLPCKSNKYRPKFLASKFLFYYAVFLLLLKFVVIPILFYFPRTVFFADITKISLMQLTNNARENSGFAPLKESQALSLAADLKARDMIEKDYFAHYSPEGVSPWYWLRASGYDYGLAGENLAIGFLESEQVHRAWMNSFSHQKNILNPAYQEIGLAVLRGNFQGNETTLVVQYFGAPKTVVLEQEPIASHPLPAPAAREELKVETEEPGKTEKEELPEERDLSFEPEKEAVLAAQESFDKNFVFSLLQFMTGDYYNLLQKIIYGSLFLVIFSLFATVYCDIFVYRKLKVDYKDIVFKAAGFSALWFVLIFLDKLAIVQIISQNFRIN